MQLEPVEAEGYNVGGKVLQFAIWLGVAAFFGYGIYSLAVWLFFGAGSGLLLVGVLVGAVYMMFGWLPARLSKWAGTTEARATRDVRLVLLFLVGFTIGCCVIPKHFFAGTAWYWRIPLGIGVGVLGLMTRRYP